MVDRPSSASSERLHRLAAARWRIALILTFAMMAVYFGFILLVAFDNITDYGTNYLFVQHVMSMDTTFPGNALMYRSITNPVLWHIGYALIIAAEGITSILFLAGGAMRFYGLS